MQNQNKNEHSEVRQLLRDSFPPLASRADLRPLQHHEAVVMRSGLASLRDEDLPYYLPQILEDLLDTHTGRAGYSENAEAVIQHLNVLVEGADLDTILDHLGSSALTQTLVEERLLRARLAEAYSSFTREQALAISKWLELTAEWGDLKWYGDEIKAAMRYWQHRASPAREGSKRAAP